MAADEPDHRVRHWNRIAQQWWRIGPPIRPSAADVESLCVAIGNMARRHGGARKRALLLGVTPELADLHRRERVDLVAIDRSAEMVRVVWPGDLPGRRAVCADWFRFLASAQPYDVILGDGSFNTVRHPDEMLALARLAHAALVDQGVLATRLFVEPQRRETVDAVLREGRSGAIAGFPVFKFRLAMALQSESGGGVRIADIWRAWHGAGINESKLAQATGWTLEEIDTIHLYRDSPGYIWFPTLRQAVDLFSKLFKVESVATADYEMGERCPTLVLVK